MSYFFIINPNAGKKKELAEKLILSEFSSKKIDFEIKYTEYKGHATELARIAILKGYKYIVAVGGDGTIREVAIPLVTRKENILGIIPSGSGNGLARNLYMPLDLSNAVKGLLEWKEREIDTILCNGQPFFCSSGVGIDAEIAYLYNKSKHSRGILPYYFSALKAYLNYKPQKISFFSSEKEFEIKPLIASVFNGEQYGGGAKMAPHAYIDDGYMDLVIIENIGFLKSLLKLRDLFNGNILNNDFVKTYKLKSLEIKAKPGLKYHLDGEDFISEEGILKFSILPNSLKVLAPCLK